MAAAGEIGALAVAIGLSVWRAREEKQVTAYGSARRADRTEVHLVKLLGDDGVMLGRWHGHYLRHDGPEHVLCFAPSGAAKALAL
jgi:type IV secretion system protein VirD4